MVGDQAFDLVDALRAIELEYANPAMVEGSPHVPEMGWLPETNQFVMPVDTPPAVEARTRAQWAAREDAHFVLCRRMVERGVRISAGTDATSHLVIPGFSLHDELQSLTRCGMSPADALKTATVVPDALMDGDAGFIAPGRRADLLLLSANPLEAIANTRRIEAVVADGRYLDRLMLDRMLEAVRDAHAASRKFDLPAYR
ncbi:MAG: amidohydrolase family protein [Halieaceae bacterium]|jgi:imidazolonepropionase-like amidohydrolase|nr:amidohydrolase family protein [Halieaceae bacterium]